MVVGPRMSGKSFFVKQMLERDHIEYDDPRKQRRIHWFYGKYQDMFNDMRRNMGKIFTLSKVYQNLSPISAISTHVTTIF